MKTILVHLSGDDRDETVLGSATAVGQHFSSHLTCLRIEPDALAMVSFLTGLDMAPPGAIGDAVQKIQQETRERTRRAAETFLHVCKSQDITRLDAPPPPHHMTASWIVRQGEVIDSLAATARFHDLSVVAGGSRRATGISVDDLGNMIFTSGRPVLLASGSVPAPHFRTVVIAWKDRPEAARALTAAMPLLERAAQVIVVGVTEGGADQQAVAVGLAPVVEQLRWHGIDAHQRVITRDDRRVSESLFAAAAAAQADLLVMGAYGHSRLREIVFGGVTEDVLQGVDIPVLLMH
jgi:nucleotide-binding universal stress UspA family protein